MNEYQEPKYKVDNGVLVNRQSGEAVPDDEPIFILRARDKKAAELLFGYAEKCLDKTHREAVRIRAHQFLNWAEKHPDRMKEPDTHLTTSWTSAGSPSFQPKK